MCPKGDDPVTVSQTYRSIKITTSAATGSLSGTVSINFLGYTTSFDADPSVTDGTACATAINNLDNVLSATCIQGATASGGAPYTIVFTAWPTFPMEDNIHSHTGNPDLTDFSCDISSMSGDTPACAITDMNTGTDDIIGNDVKSKPFRFELFRFSQNTSSVRGEGVANLALEHAFAMLVILVMRVRKQQVLSPQVTQLQAGSWM